MALIEWTSNLSVGVDEMDQQHRKLVSLINQFHDALKVGHGDQIAAGILVQLVQYTQTHFAAEEHLMARFGYPELHNHKKLHAVLVEQVGRMAEKIKSGKMVSPVSIATFLKDWLSQHILGTDKLYGQFITASAPR
ncbi:MAG: hemerythrin family protein [Phycisphaerae bacterium]|nr:hemerythrin family protein [Phycisphaerae bacterium]